MIIHKQKSSWTPKMKRSTEGGNLPERKYCTWMKVWKRLLERKLMFIFYMI
jgi:hypothetical protein